MLSYEDILRKLITPAEAGAILTPEFRKKNRIVFTNGCFDVLHRGHVYYLSKAREMGSLLIVGLNSDDSVSRLKGDGRPVNKQNARAEVMGALGMVDYIILFGEDTPLDLTDIVVSDVDDGNLAVSLTLSDPAVGALSTGAAGGVISTYNPGTGKWQASGPVESVNTLLTQVRFTPAADISTDFTIAVTVDDTIAPPITGSKAITGLPVGDTPRVDDITTDRLTQSELIIITPNENDGAEVSHFRVSGIQGGSLFLANGTTQVRDGEYITVAQGLAGVRFTPLITGDSDGSFQAESSQDGVTVAAQSDAAASIITVTGAQITPEPPKIIDETPETTPDPETDTPAETEDEGNTEPEVEEDTDLIAEETLDPQDEVDSNEAAADPKQTVVTSSLKMELTPAGITFKPAEIASLNQDFFTENHPSGQTSGNNGLRSSSPTRKNTSHREIDWGADYKMTSILLQTTFDAMEQETAREIRLEKTVIGSAFAATTSLSVGYVVWLIRSGMLLSSLLSSLPAWQIADPLPILARLKDDEDEDDESIEEIIGDDDTEQEAESRDGEKKDRPDVA